jgi:hypothetical protein
VSIRASAACPNAGQPRLLDSRMLYMATPEYFAVFGRRMLKAGVRGVGSLSLSVSFTHNFSLSLSVSLSLSLSLTLPLPLSVYLYLFFDFLHSFLLQFLLPTNVRLTGGCCGTMAEHLELLSGCLVASRFQKDIAEDANSFSLKFAFSVIFFSLHFLLL